MPILSVLFVSRNKDNKSVPDFKQRSTEFLTSLSPDNDSLKRKFKNFVADGKPGEVSRLYISINHRNITKINTQLILYLAKHIDYDPAKIPGKINSIAMHSENAETHRWLIDFDDTKNNLSAFINDLKANGFSDNELELHPSKTNYHIIISHGFDIRQISQKWPDVTIQRDGFYLKTYERNDIS